MKVAIEIIRDYPYCSHLIDICLSFWKKTKTESAYYFPFRLPILFLNLSKDAAGLGEQNAP